MADTAITPAIGSLAISTSDAEFENSGDMKLIFSGSVPKITINPVGPVDSIALSITGYAPTRPHGLQLTTFTPSAEITVIKPMLVGSAVFSGYIPEVVIAAPPNLTISPPSVDLSFTGIAPELNQHHVIQAVLGSLSITTTPPFPAKGIPIPSEVNPFGDTSATILGISSDAPTIRNSRFGDNEGTAILNANAVTDSPNRYNICSRSGFRAKPGELIKDGYGDLVLPEFSEQRHPQDLLRSRTEKRVKGAIRPEPVKENEINYITTDVTVDDL